MKRSTKFVLYCAIFLLGLPLVSSSQIVINDSTSHWRKKLVFNLNLNQAAFSSNWKAGGIN